MSIAAIMKRMDELDERDISDLLHEVINNHWFDTELKVDYGEMNLKEFLIGVIIYQETGANIYG